MRPLRRAADINWGNRVRVYGGEEADVAWISVEQSAAHTVYVSATPMSDTPSLEVVATIEWGHGGASVSQAYPVAGRLRVPVAASMVRVTARIIDRTGARSPASLWSDVTAIIAEGNDGDDRSRPVQWLAGTGPEGVLSTRPVRIASLEAFGPLPSARTLMLFDTPKLPPDGATPDASHPIDPFPQSLELRYPDGRPFHAGVSWAISTDPLVLARDAAANVRLEVGVLL